MVLTANEAIASRLKSSINGELDIKKINDPVNLGILVVVLEQMGFGSKLIQYIKWCITIAHFSILGNGTPSSFSSYIFILAMQALSSILNRAREGGFIRIIKGFTVSGRGIEVSPFVIWG